MSRAVPFPTQLGADKWLDNVASGTAVMSQRKYSSVEKRGGGLPTVQALALEKGVHLLMLTDDKGGELVAASLHPFQVLG